MTTEARGPCFLAPELPRVAPAFNRVEWLLALPEGEVPRLTADELGESAFLLSRYAFWLQRAQNEKEASRRAAERALQARLAHALPRQRGASLEERRLSALRGDEQAAALDAALAAAQAECDRLAYLAARVDGLARAALALQQTRRKTNGQPA